LEVVLLDAGLDLLALEACLAVVFDGAVEVGFVDCPLAAVLACFDPGICRGPIATRLPSVLLTRALSTTSMSNNTGASE